MRLIDADELIKGTLKNDPVRIAAMRAPTAYDVDIVVERLKKETEDLTSWAEDMAYQCAIDKAIEIVKKGWSKEMTKEHPTAHVPEQEKIISKVLEERKRQDAKWGEQNHTVPVWGMIIGEEYGEMCKAINEFGFSATPEKEQDIYTEAMHTMASCMAMLECIERNRGKN